jgi:4-amino-4-deoxy-L-arabinose transferase-like glycosyltransferase
MPGFVKRRLLPLTDSPDSELWRKDNRFWWHPHDFLIGLFNQVLFFAVVVLTFFLTRKLFDPGAAWLAAAILFGCELLWRFSVSGLSTMLLLLIFTGLIWCLVLIEGEAREPKWGAGRLILLGAAAGLLVGLGMLTRYAFGWLIVPVVVFFILFAGQRRMALVAAALGMFLVVAGPWIYRNYSVSGTPFGTASYSVMEGAGLYAEHQLQRSLEPVPARGILRPVIVKLLNNSRQILLNDLPRLGGNWITPFFLVGLLIGFRSLAIRRLRYFVVGTMFLLVIVQALGRTQLSDDSPELNSENLLVLLVPMVTVFGVSLFYLLLDQMALLFQGLRYIVVGAFGVVMCLPMAFSFLPPRSRPVAYPPYYPPVIQQTAGWMGEGELMMSDIPWAVAWYGKRQCIWLTLNAQSEFFAVNDYLKPIRALYLTPQTMDSRFLSQWVRPGEHSWGSFILASTVNREIPRNFPLRKAPTGFLPEQLFLTDWERWRRPVDDSSP